MDFYIYIYLVGGFNHLEKYEFVNGKDNIPYLMENESHVPNHQPDIKAFVGWPTYSWPHKSWDEHDELNWISGTVPSMAISLWSWMWGILHGYTIP